MTQKIAELNGTTYFEIDGWWYKKENKYYVLDRCEYNPILFQSLYKIASLTLELNELKKREKELKDAGNNLRKLLKPSASCNHYDGGCQCALCIWDAI